MTKKKKAIVSTIIFIIFFNIGTKFLGFYRDALIGRQLGAELETDAYLMSLSATTLIFLSIGTGISTTLIPIISKIEDKEYRRKIINNILNFILLVSLGIAVVYFLGSDIIVSIVAGGFTGEKFDLTVSLTKILIPTVFFINIAYVFVGILQSNEKFLLPTLISLPYNIIIIIYLFVGAEKYGVEGLAIITTIGWLLQLLVQVPTIIKLKEIKYSFKIDFKGEELQRFIKGLLPVVFVVATNQLATVTDNSFISHFGDGKPAAFYYANMLYVAVATIIVFGITSVMFPKFNKNYMENKASFYETITTVLEGVVLLLVPVGIGIAVVSKEFISLIFLSDEFTMDSVILTANFLKAYGMFMVTFGILDIINKAYYTKDNRKTPVIISASILIINLVLNYVLIKALNVGIYGVIISTGIAFYIGVFISLYLFKSEEGNINYKSFLTTCVKSVVAVVVMYVAITLIQNFLYSVIDVNDFLSRLIFLCVSAIGGVAIYFGVLILLKEKTIIRNIKNLLKK
ncbi:MAG: murein biosynthesis integral membrane protein MurJ [Lachnospirales bacterium]